MTCFIDIWKKYKFLEQIENSVNMDMMSLQDINCGEDPTAFVEYPRHSTFKEKEVLESEYGDGYVSHEMSDIISDHPTKLPYYIALLRKN